MNALMVIMGILGFIGVIEFFVMLKSEYDWNGCLTGVLGFVLASGYVGGVVPCIAKLWDWQGWMFADPYYKRYLIAICIVVPVGIILGIIALIKMDVFSSYSSSSSSSSSSSTLPSSWSYSDIRATGQSEKCGSCWYWEPNKRKCWCHEGVLSSLAVEDKRRWLINSATQCCIYYGIGESRKKQYEKIF